MRMILTHRITDDTRTLTMRLIRLIMQLDHREQDTTLYRFQTISYIRQCSGSDNAHRIVDVGFLHRFFQVNIIDPVKYLIIHGLTH